MTPYSSNPRLRKLPMPMLQTPGDDGGAIIISKQGVVLIVARTDETMQKQDYSYEAVPPTFHGAKLCFGQAFA